MQHPPKSTTITQLLILLNAAIWGSYSLYTLLTRNTSGTGLSAAAWVMSALAFAAAAALVITVLLMRKRNRWGFYFSLALLALIAVLSITDEVGLLDVLSLLVSLAPLILLIRDRKWYLQKVPRDQEG